MRIAKRVNVWLTYGSPAADVQLMVTVPPLVISLGAERVRAETKGATSARRLSK